MIKWYKADTLPTTPTVLDDGVWFVKKGKDFFDVYIISEGVIKSLDIEVPTDVEDSRYIELTKTQLDTAIANSELVAGALYKITEVETWMKQGDTTKAIYLHAISNTELEKKGMGEFYVPKYNQQEVGYGIWAGELWQKTNRTMGTEPSYNIDDVVIWGGKHWKNLTGDYGTFIDHYELDGTNWEEIPVNDTDYNVRINIIEYDYVNDMITYRKDDAGNEVSTSYENWKDWENIWFNRDLLSDSNYNPTKIVQWGNELDYNSYVGVGFNTVENGIFECINQRGATYENTINRGIFSDNTLNSGYVIGNTVENQGYIRYNTLINGNISGNIVTGGYISNNIMNNGRILNNGLGGGIINNNTLNNGRIEHNTLNYGNIDDNTLENNGRIESNTITNGYIRLGTSNPINNKRLRNLTINTGDIGGASGIDLSSATLVYYTFERIVFKNSTGVTKIRYIGEKGELVVADITD